LFPVGSVMSFPGDRSPASFCRALGNGAVVVTPVLSPTEGDLMATQVKNEVALSLWSIDTAHSSVHFKVRHMAISWVRGEFRSVSGTLNLDEYDMTRSLVAIDIDVSSVYTRDAQRDQHLRSADFLDVEKYPEMHFQSTAIASSGSNSYRLTGDLTIHGVSREIDLDVREVSPIAKDPWGNIRLEASATARVSRKEFGLTWNTVLESGGLLVGDEIVIAVDVEFVKSPSQDS
jgi:polyisoprenoid-binding protein YceI